MLRIAHIEEITDLLLRVPGLVQLQEARSADFAIGVDAWLKLLEDSLAAARLPQTAVVAALRGTLISAGQGQLPAGIVFRGRSTHARVVAAAASNALNEATSVAAAVLMDNQSRLNEATRVATQIAALASSRGLIPVRKPDSSGTDYLNQLRSALEAVDDLNSALVHLDALVGPFDALVTLDRAVQRFTVH